MRQKGRDAAEAASVPNFAGNSGEPDALKGACPVRKGAVGNVTSRPTLTGGAEVLFRGLEKRFLSPSLGRFRRSAERLDKTQLRAPRGVEGQPLTRWPPCAP